MLKNEIIDDKFCKHYSDTNKMIKKIGTNEIYSEAIDLLPCKYEYEETDIEIEIVEQEDFIHPLEMKVRVINNGIN